MKLYLTRDEEGLALWRVKPFLNGDGCWWTMMKNLMT